MSSSPTYLDPIVIPLIKGETVLDVGCGYGRWANLIRSNFWEAEMAKPPLVDGFDAFENNVEFCRGQNAYREVWQHLLPEPLSGKWDTVLACEIIEHIPQEQTASAIAALEAVAAKRIIFSTPNFPNYRGGLDTIVGYNEYEAHVSYVSRAEFRRRGYRVVGAGFGNPESLLTRGLWKLDRRTTQWFQSVSRLFPSLGTATVAYKDFDRVD